MKPEYIEVKITKKAYFTVWVAIIGWLLVLSKIIYDILTKGMWT